jgi:hypothetical protein
VSHGIPGSSPTPPCPSCPGSAQNDMGGPCFPIVQGHRGKPLPTRSVAILVTSTGEPPMPPSRKPPSSPARPWGSVLVLAFAVAGCGGETMGAHDAAVGGETNGHPTSLDRPTSVPPGGAADLARLRGATAAYHDFTKALDAGFEDASGIQECVSHPELGGMGIHYVRSDGLGEPSIDPARPEILLYMPHPEGRMELVGAEFAVNAEAWHRAHGPDTVPQVAAVRYDPPDPHALHPLPRTSYTLHVWLWKDNPAGMFAPFNPALSCG